MDFLKQKRTVMIRLRDFDSFLFTIFYFARFETLTCTLTFVRKYAASQGKIAVVKTVLIHEAFVFQLLNRKAFFLPIYFYTLSAKPSKFYN